MKISFIPVSVVLSLLTMLLANPASAAELLDVKPVVTGANLVIEVTADIPMTYTYYKVPGQARAVVDIADADPEKVEPLIVVNKGAVSSISVDKAMIGDMTVSRLIFNLVSESAISVNHVPDRKTLNVSFGGGKAAAAPAAPPAPAASVAPVAVPEPKEPAAPAPAAVTPVPKEPAAAATAQPGSKEEDDPLGLDEPRPAAASAEASAPIAVRSTKLEPVVPAIPEQTSSAAMVTVIGIVIGSSYIDIQANGAIDKFKQLKLSKPERLFIEIPGTNSMSVSSVQVKKFGISNVRIGKTPGYVRVVLDTAKPAFPRYKIVAVENGLRINFK
jgi:hypothetical protein